MTAESLFEFHSRQPFVPFIVSMADGKSYLVEHPEVLAYVPGARTAALYIRGNNGDAWRILDVSLMTSLETHQAKKKRPRRRAG